MIKAKNPREIYLMDGKLSAMGPVTHLMKVPMDISSHRELATFQVANLESHEHQQKIIMRLLRRCCVRMLGVGNFAPVTAGAFCGGLRHSVASGGSGGTVASTLISGC